jgi:hypothetical protein
VILTHCISTKWIIINWLLLRELESSLRDVEAERGGICSRAKPAEGIATTVLLCGRKVCLGKALSLLPEQAILLWLLLIRCLTKVECWERGLLVEAWIHRI